MNCQCECQDYDECINCAKYDFCEDKPHNPRLKWVILGWIAVLITTAIIIID